MNIYVIKQDADYDEFEGFTVAAHDEVEAEQVIREWIVPQGSTDYFNPPGAERTLTDAERMARVENEWPSTPPNNWRNPLNRTTRLVGTTAPDITEPVVLLSAYKRG